MARYLTRVNIETSFFSDRRNQKLQSALFNFEGISKFDAARYLATGLMVDLWRLSQAEKVSEATREQIDDWLFEGATDLLLDAGFISETNASFYIKGNAEQLDGINAWLEQKAVAGKRSAERRAGKRAENHDASQKMVNDRSTTVQRPFNDRSTTVQRKSTQLQDQYQDQLQDQKEEEENTPPASAKRQRAPRLRFEQDDLTLALEWIDWAHESEPHLKLKPETIADAIRKAREYTERDHSQMRNIFDWIKQDDFWQKNCLSPTSLLNTSKNGVKKIDNVLASISRDKGYVARLQMSEWESEGIKPLF